MKFFSYDSEDGFDFHETRDGAIDTANANIDCHREHADDGWCEDVEYVCWGIVCETATEERGEVIDDYGDYSAEYHLTDKGCGDVSTLAQRIAELEGERDRLTLRLSASIKERRKLNSIVCENCHNQGYIHGADDCNVCENGSRFAALTQGGE